MPQYSHHTAHAEHNLQAAKYLINNKVYYDWSATMAFYSAVHYVESVLDYLATKKTNLNYFNHSLLVAHSDELTRNIQFPTYKGKPLQSAHQVRKELVDTNFPTISWEYSLLFDASWCQRYTNYKQNNHNKCERLLEKQLTKIQEWHSNIVKTITPETSIPLCKTPELPA